MGKILNLLRIIKALPKSLIVNFRFLPFSQAIKLPILAFNINLKGLGGGQIIIHNKIKFGMIRLGQYEIAIFPEKKFVMQNNGIIEIYGECKFGKGCAMSVWSGGRLIIGDGVTGTYGIKLIASNKVTIGAKTLIGWNARICDCDFHLTKSMETGEKIGHKSGEIVIGENCWIASDCRLMKNARIPDKTTVGTGTFISRPIDVPPGSVIANPRPVVAVATGRWLDINDN